MGLFALIICFVLLSSTQGSFGPGEQDYGYVTVRQGAHMFWWLYHTSADVPDSADRPLILWLMGGPGGSSTGHGNFQYVGPIDEHLNPRESTWVKDFNVLFVDNPVGAGYSFVEDLRYLAKDNKEIARDLLELLRGFLLRLPKFRTTPLYIYGISYGGKMGTDFVRLLYDEIQAGNIEANLQGLLKGNPWTSPIDYTVSYADYLYEVGLIDETAQFFIQQQALYTKEMYDSGQLYHATLEWSRTFGLIYFFTDGVDIYNILTKMPMTPAKDFKEFMIDYMTSNGENTKEVRDIDALMNGPVKEALNIPPFVQWGALAIALYESLFADIMTSVTETLESILTDTDLEVHVCNGNLDLIVPTPGVNLWISKLNWPDADAFRSAPRNTLWINNTLEGYERRGGRFNYYWMNVAGHEALTDNIPATRHFLRAATGV